MHVLDQRAAWLARHILPHEPALRAWLMRRQVAGLDVDDIVQETYARLSMTEKVDHIREPRVYMFQTARSVIVTYIRHSRVISIQSVGQSVSFDIADDVPDPETQASDRDELRRLAEAIAFLPEKIRDVILLRRIEGLSQRQVAERLGLSESTVEKHMSNGFRRLGEAFRRGGKPGRSASSQNIATSQEHHDQRDKPGD